MNGIQIQSSTFLNIPQIIAPVKNVPNCKSQWEKPSRMLVNPEAFSRVEKSLTQEMIRRLKGFKYYELNCKL